MPRIKPHSRVSSEAWRFDVQRAEYTARWSYSVFGASWRDARIIGTVVRMSGNMWIINWDLDGDNSTNACNPDNLVLEMDDIPRQVLPIKGNELLCMYNNKKYLK